MNTGSVFRSIPLNMELSIYRPCRHQATLVKEACRPRRRERGVVYPDEVR